MGTVMSLTHAQKPHQALPLPIREAAGENVMRIASVSLFVLRDSDEQTRAGGID
jgi:hypothetical protein